ncbi:hypothetical protein Zmor_022999 [Zophobas morio]|uniref:Uncharacterized protein n=1 Tax=Zophobas morio TaxID=2755281 RepID=A0AA38HXH9_9CUCU|nr:hypothetical protein Zmor_022999 [Zophobas morio]
MIKSSRASPWEAAEGASAVSKQVNKTTNQSMKLSENMSAVTPLDHNKRSRRSCHRKRTLLILSRIMEGIR